MDNQIFRIPIKYGELMKTMEKAECGKLILALMEKDKSQLEGLTETYYNIIIIDITNIENQVMKGKEGGKKGGRPKKETLRDNNKITPPLQNKEPNISKDNIIEVNISKDNYLVVSKETTLQEYIKKEFDNEFLSEVYNKFNLDKEIFKEECEAFLNYWIEKSPSGKKEKRQKEKTFDPKLRFRQWMKNTNRWNKPNLSFNNKIGVVE